jgi:hypothetical protein
MRASRSRKPELNRYQHDICTISYVLLRSHTNRAKRALRFKPDIRVIDGTLEEPSC